MLDVNLLLAWGATYKKISSGDVIISEGNPCNFYFQLITGRVRWVNIDEDGKEFLHCMIEKGECFGDLPLTESDHYSGTAIAEHDCVIIRLHAPIFRQLLEEKPGLHLDFTIMLSHHIQKKSKTLCSLAFDHPEQRILNLLETLVNENRNICKKCRQLTLTRQQIADMTGLRVETVIRAMRHMHERGELTIEKGKVYC
jgi:CRP-like cAMP-binding protein